MGLFPKRIKNKKSFDFNNDSEDQEKELTEEDEVKQGNNLLFCIIIICVLLTLGVIDGFTTTYAKRGSIAFARWTAENEPGSFVLYLVIIIILIVCCLPYGPLSVLMGAVFTDVYGFKKGVLIGILCLFLATMTAAMICFTMARKYFQGFVQRKIGKNPKLSFLRSLDRLIKDGQGLEMVILLRLAPLPTGPTQYFLGTTSVKWVDFLAGNSITNIIFSVTDIMIGAGASSLRGDNLMGIVFFIIGVLSFFALILYVGFRAKKKLVRLDRQETLRQETMRLAVKSEEEEDLFRTDDERRQRRLKYSEKSHKGIHNNRSTIARADTMETVNSTHMGLAVAEAPISDEELGSSRRVK